MKLFKAHPYDYNHFLNELLANNERVIQLLMITHFFRVLISFIFSIFQDILYEFSNFFALFHCLFLPHRLL